MKSGIFFVFFTLSIMHVPALPLCAQETEFQELVPISQKTRLVVFSPHPDDEVLGAGGLIQRVLGEGGTVKVVFLTSGDGFQEGVALDNQTSNPTPEDYRDYGEDRRKEAITALAILGMDKEDIVFLDFPDMGLRQLLCEYRSDPQIYTSPFTLENHPSASDTMVSHSGYNGKDLKRTIFKVLADFRPTLIALTSPEDVHPDHWSTFFFVREGLLDFKGRYPAFEPTMLEFLIHYGKWPLGQGADNESRIDPPIGFPKRETGWVALFLSPTERSVKRKAIYHYHTQMLMMGEYLLSFAKANELFLLRKMDWAEELKREPCSSN